MATTTLHDDPPSDDQHNFNSTPVPLLDRSETAERVASSPANTQTRSPIEQFINNFFQEKNIRWMLIVGAAIVFGSSLMMVTRQWSHWPVALQYLTILGYTAVIYGFAELGRVRLGLLTTAKVLHTLTLLLLPVSFLSLSWLTSRSGNYSPLATVEAIILLIPATLLTWFASTRILDGWLQGRQRTFVASYVVLCLAGALPIILNSWIAVIVSAFLWLVMTAGIVKVNRHVFWLVEEYRTPRVFGFLPIGLLGAQFIILMATKTWRAIPIEWLGLDCVAVAATVLLTVRTIADVYRQRTGDLVRPLPWNIVAPLLVGIVLTATGVCLSFHDFSYFGPTTLAVVPTCTVAAILMMLIANETRYRGFVWSALVLTAVAYQTTPTLMSDLVQQLKSGAAHAIAEERLPFAFYGLTYLPLLLASAIGSRFFANRKQAYLSEPCQQFCTVIATFLFALSFMHLKALFLVSCVNFLLFLFFAATFRDRRYAIASIAALVLVAASWVPFGNMMGWFQISQFVAVTSVALLACSLVSTQIPDRLLQRIPNNGREGCSTTLVQNIGLILTLAQGIFAIAFLLANFGEAWSLHQSVAFAAILGAIFASVVRTRHYFVGLGFWLVLAVGVSSWLFGLHFTLLNLVSGLTVATTTLSLLVAFGIKYLRSQPTLRHSLSMYRKRIGMDLPSGLITWPKANVDSPASEYPSWKAVALAFLLPIGDLSFFGALALTLSFHAPAISYSNLFFEGLLIPISSSLVILWMLVLGMAFKNRIASIATYAILPLWMTAVLITTAPGLLSMAMLPLIWSITAGVILFIDAAGSPHREGSYRYEQYVGFAWLAGIIAISLYFLSLPTRASGLLSLAMLGWFIHHRSSKFATSILAILGNLQLLLVAGYLGGMHGTLPNALTQFQFVKALPSILPVIGLSIVFFDQRWSWLDSSVSRDWARGLRSAMVLGVVVSFMLLSPPPSHVLSLFLAIVIASIAEFCEGVRREKEVYVWSGMAGIAVAGLWLAYHGVIEIGAGASQFVMLTIAILSLATLERLRNNLRLRVFTRPLRMIGLVLPAVVVGSAVAQELNSWSLVWPGFNTLALFSAAGIYFHCGLTTGQRGYHVASGAIVNITLALLWNSMKLYDFQFYLVPLGLSIIGLVELLKKEIPVHAHEPMRYIGALTILVSPVFEILQGSWWHLFSLMVLCVLVILLSIGLRLRVLVYTGSAFLVADMAGMIVRTTIDHPNMLWVGGVGLGIAVIALAALCERHREHLLAKIRLLSNELQAWN